MTRRLNLGQERLAVMTAALHAKGVAIWRKEPDGSWRCVIDIWNEAPPPVDAPGP